MAMGKYLAELKRRLSSPAQLKQAPCQTQNSRLFLKAIIMPNKALLGLGRPPSNRRRTPVQKKAKTARAVREERLVNLEKGRKKRQANLRKQKKEAKVKAS